MTKCGSPVYMSPELCAGRPYDRGCDAWALGCVLYEMMSLAVPWVDQLPQRHGILGLMRLICSGSLDLSPLRQHYSAELCSVLAVLLRKQRQHRPSFRRLLQVPLIKGTLARLHHVHSTPPSTPPSSSPLTTPPSTPPSTPPYTPPLSPVDAQHVELATGDAPDPAVADELRPAPPPARLAAPHRLNAIEAAAKHMNCYDGFGQPYGLQPHANPFDARRPFARPPKARAHGIDVHAAALVVQRSFYARQRANPRLPARAAGMPSRPPSRPPWAVVR